LVTAGGRVVVLDFGIIADLRSSRPISVADTDVIGTPAYMAPEQLEEGAVLSPAADWYAFGVMLYECLTGRLPFAGAVAEVIARKLLEDPVPVAQLAPEAPADLVEL